MVEQHQSEMQSRVAAREAAQISTMMADLARVVEILDSEIAAEERRARISDPSNIAYPIAALTWSARRENIKDDHERVGFPGWIVSRRETRRDLPAGILSIMCKMLSGIG